MLSKIFKGEDEETNLEVMEEVDEAKHQGGRLVGTLTSVTDRLIKRNEVLKKVYIDKENVKCKT